MPYCIIIFKILQSIRNSLFDERAQWHASDYLLFFYSATSLTQNNYNDHNCEHLVNSFIQMFLSFTNNNYAICNFTCYKPLFYAIRLYPIVLIQGNQLQLLQPLDRGHLFFYSAKIIIQGNVNLTSYIQTEN